jgi:hypothetical protein
MMGLIDFILRFTCGDWTGESNFKLLEKEVSVFNPGPSRVGHGEPTRDGRGCPQQQQQHNKSGGA